MRIQGGAAGTLVLAAGLACTSCFDVPLIHHNHLQTRVFIPPPPPPRPARPPVPLLPDPPQTQLALASIPTPQFGGSAIDFGPPPPAPVKRPPVAPPKTQATAPPPQEPPTPAAPKLGQMFPAEQARQMTQELSDSFARVDSALARLEGKRLTAEQLETADRIRTFRKQAEQAREQDLVTAVSLARRADLLAKDLLGRLP